MFGHGGHGLCANIFSVYNRNRCGRIEYLFLPARCRYNALVNKDYFIAHDQFELVLTVD